MAVTHAVAHFTDVPISTPIAMTATANTSRTTFATGTDLYTTTGAGFNLYGIDFVCTGTSGNGVSTAGVIRIWIHDGTSYFYQGEILVSAVASPGASTSSWAGRWTPAGGVLRLPPGYKIAATTHNAEGFNARVDGEGYSA